MSQPARLLAQGLFEGINKRELLEKCTLPKFGNSLKSILVKIQYEALQGSISPLTEIEGLGPPQFLTEQMESHTTRDPRLAFGGPVVRKHASLRFECTSPTLGLDPDKDSHCVQFQGDPYEGYLEHVDQQLGKSQLPETQNLTIIGNLRAQLERSPWQAIGGAERIFAVSLFAGIESRHMLRLCVTEDQKQELTKILDCVDVVDLRIGKDWALDKRTGQLIKIYGARGGPDLDQVPRVHFDYVKEDSSIQPRSCSTDTWVTVDEKMLEDAKNPGSDTDTSILDHSEVEISAPANDAYGFTRLPVSRGWARYFDSSHKDSCALPYRDYKGRSST